MDLKILKTIKTEDLMEIKVLDLSSQNLNTIPEEVYQMYILEDIIIGKGNDIQVSDRYKLLDSLPSIKTIDTKDVSQVRSGITNLNSIFVRRLQEMFLTKAASEIYCEETSEESRIEKMVQLAKMTINAGPEVLKDFKDYKIEKLIRENYEIYVSEALEVTVKLKEGKENKGPPGKKRKVNANNKGKTKAKQLTVKVSKHSLDIGSSLNLEYLLLTHSKNNDRNDFQTKVWMCEFEPDINNPGKTTNMVATCGGNSICLIDCDTGAVMKKYKQPGEEFYCLCWTVLEYKNTITGEEQTRTMLAAAGVLGVIKIIDPKQFICYDNVSRHKHPVDALLFHPNVPHWMFSGSEDKTIVLWDFSKPYSEDRTNAQKLVTFMSNTTGTVRQIGVVPHGNIVLGACDDGLYAWEVEPTNVAVRNPSYKIDFKGKPSHSLDSASCISNNLLAVKRVHEGNIQLFHSASEFIKDDANIIYSLTWRITETPFLKFNFCRGSNTLLAGDDEGVIWLYDLNNLVQVTKKSKIIKLNHDIFPKKLRCENPNAQVFNHVSSSSSLNHVVAVSDTNLVAIWRTRDKQT